MLSTFRKFTKVVIWLVVIAFVGTIIFAWGMDITRSKTQKNVIGTIGGKNIDYPIYQKYLDNLYQAQQAKSEEELDDAMVRRIRRQAWNNLVADYLTDQEIQKRKIQETDEEVVNFLRYAPPQELQQNPGFQTNGKFDPQKYMSAMADPNPQAVQFWAQVEAVYRPQLRKMKLQEQIVSTVRVTEDEVRDLFLSTHEKVKADVIPVPVIKYSQPGPTVTDEDIRKYYEDHKDKYKAEERASLDFVLFPKEATEADWARVKAEAEEYKSKIDKGEDFAEMAKAYSEDNTAQNGGDVGWFKRGQMLKPFEDAAFSMAVGQVSEPIRSQLGWHIIKLLGRRGEKDSTEVNASHILLRVKVSSETIDQAYKNANNLLDELSGSDLAGAAKKLSLTVQNTGLFAKVGSIPKIGDDPKITQFAFDQAIGTVSPIFETDAGIVVARVAEKVPAGTMSFDEAKSQAKYELINELSMKMCEDLARKIYAAVKSGTTFAQAATTFGVSLESTDWILRGGYVKNVGSDPVLMGAIFRLTTPGQISDPIKYNRGWAVARLVERQGADLSQFSQVHDSLQTQLLGQKQSEAFNAWFNDLVTASKVEDYIDEFFSNK